jgi:hypothetical protein
MSANEPQMQPPTPPPPQAIPPAAASYAAGRRSPGVAVILGCFPGLGHLYLGLYQRGLGFFIAFATSIWLADHSDLGILIPFIWFFSQIDAYRQAVLINTCVDTGAMPEPMKLPKQRSSLGFGAFLLVLGLLLLYNQFYPLDLTFLVDWWPLALVLAGAYLLLKHFLEQKKLRDAEQSSPTF